MHPAPPKPHQTCGRCAKFDPSRDPKYGYCKPHMALERDRRGYPKPRLVDVDTPCFMLSADWQTGGYAFEPRKGAQ